VAPKGAPSERTYVAIRERIRNRRKEAVMAGRKFVKAVLAAAAVAVLSVACTATEASPLEDGTHEGWLSSITTEEVGLQLVRVLTGEEAVQAAREDGHQVEEGGLPNDVYVRELDRAATMRIAPGATARVLDCTQGCEEVDTTFDALATGRTRPYGGESALVRVTVEDGKVVALVEQYLP
jgi:hypothetical protein